MSVVARQNTAKLFLPIKIYILEAEQGTFKFRLVILHKTTIIVNRIDGSPAKFRV